MRKFKSFMASVLTYVMIMSLIPTNFTQMIAKASENEYVAFVKSGYYLKGEAQYGEEILVAYGKGQNGDTDIVLVRNGKETLLKQVPGYDIVQVFENGTNKVGISYDKYEEEGVIRTFEEFDFTTRTFREITKEEFNNLLPRYENDYEMEIIDLSDRDVVNNFLKSINDRYDLNLNIDDKEYLEYMSSWGNVDSNEYVYININSAHNNLYTFTYREYSFEDDSKNIEYTGLVYNDNVYLIETTGRYYDISYDIVDNNTIYIWETINEDENEYRLIKLQDGKEISNAEIKFEELSYFSRLKEVNNNIYIYDSKKIYIYELLGEVYKNTNTIDIIHNIFNSSEKSMLEKSDGKMYLSVLNDDGLLRIKDLTEEVNSIYSENNYINIESNNDVFSIVTSSGFILVQKKVEEMPEETPDVPEETPDVPEETPDVPEETPDVPEETPDVPEETPDVPEETPDVPEETPDVPEETPDVPEETPDVPEETPDVPEETPDVPEETPDVPEETPDTPEETPDVPEETPDVPEETPDTPEETPNVPEEAPETPEETPDVPEEAPEIPEETPDIPEETPNVPNNPSDEEVVVPPTEDTKLEIEVPTLKPNEVTEVELNSENATNFNLIIKDTETIKDGEGALKAILNNVTLNLPFSVVDKDLIGENDTVSVKLDVLDDSEIVKNLKAVNKVFDFNLVVNKEGESVNIHNFKDGVAEITFALSDAELEGLNKEKLVVYYYNEETGKFEAMETKVDGNNVTFKTSHFSKYVIAEEIVDDTTDEPNTNEDDETVNDSDKDEEVLDDSDKDDEVIINPDKDDTTTNDTNNTTNNEEDKTENVQGELPTTGSVVSNNIILVLALGAVLVGGVMVARKKRVA